MDGIRQQRYHVHIDCGKSIPCINDLHDCLTNLSFDDEKLFSAVPVHGPVQHQHQHHEQMPTTREPQPEQLIHKVATTASSSSDNTDVGATDIKYTAHTILKHHFQQYLAFCSSSIDGNDKSDKHQHLSNYQHLIEDIVGVLHRFQENNKLLLSFTCSTLYVSASQDLHLAPELYKGLRISILEPDCAYTTTTTKQRQLGVAVVKGLLNLSRILAEKSTSVMTDPPPSNLEFITIIQASTSLATTKNTSCCFYVGRILQSPLSENITTPTTKLPSKLTLEPPQEQLQTASRPSSTSLQSNLWNVDSNLVLLETNIDDMTAEHISFVTELLLSMGNVIDCWTTCIGMKKNRCTACTIHCLCRRFTSTNDETAVDNDDNDSIKSILICMFRHCSTLGIRVWDNAVSGFVRVSLRREIISIPLYEDEDTNDKILPNTTTTMFDDDDVALLQRQRQQKQWANIRNTIDCKIGYLGEDEIVSIKAEYDQCHEIVIGMMKQQQQQQQKCATTMHDVKTYVENMARSVLHKKCNPEFQ